MIRIESNGSPFKVVAPASVRASLRALQREAAERGIGPAVVTAIKTIYNWLRYEPLAFGEPQYHLYKLKLQIRAGVIWPLAIDYAVHQVEPLVFIKGIRLLS